MSKARELAELGAVYDSGALSNRNMIINGAMEVAQRGTSSTFGQSDKGYKTVDRHEFFEQGSPTAVFAVTQESTGGPVGFKYSTKLNCTTQNTSGIPASVHMYMSHKIEGNYLARLSWGSSDAKKATLSFYAKSNVSGTYVVAMRAYDGSDLDYYAAPYTLDGSGNWQYITCEIPANTITTVTSAGIDYGLALEWVVQSSGEYSGGTPLTTWTENATTNQREAGQTADIGAAVNNYWQITGIQMEVGTEATPFEHRSFGDELQACSRYFQKIESLGSVASYNSFPYTGLSRATTIGKVSCGWTTPLRSGPTITFSAASDFAVVNGTGSAQAVTGTSVIRTNDNSGIIEFTVASGLTAGQATYLTTNNTADPSISVDAEL